MGRYVSEKINVNVHKAGGVYIYIYIYCTNVLNYTHTSYTSFAFREFKLNDEAKIQPKALMINLSKNGTLPHLYLY